MAKVIDVWSDRGPCLQSRHFLLQVRTNFCFDHVPRIERLKYSFPSTGNTEHTQQNYCSRFCDKVKGMAENTSLNDHANIVAAAMHVAAAENYGMTKKPRKPLVSQDILELMVLREEARKGSYYMWEISLHRQIRAGIKKGRREWLDEELIGGGWRAIKALKKGSNEKTDAG